MMTSAFLAAKAQALDMQVRRAFWQPLRRMMEIFHILPLTAALIVFFFLATDAQIREIYVAYLEDLKPPTGLMPANYASMAATYAAAAAGLALISAVLYVAHYRLSTMRINVINSSLTHSDARSMLRSIQRIAAIGLALFPWLGVATGLLGARIYLADRYRQLRDAAGVEPDTLAAMQHLPVPGAWTIAGAAIVVGLAMAIFLDANRRDSILTIALVGILPVAAAGWFLLLTDGLPAGGDQVATVAIWVVIGSIALAHYGLYHWLDRTRARLVSAHWLYRDTGINLRRRRRVLLAAWALLPWIAIALYFAFGPSFATQPPAEAPAAGATSALAAASWQLPHPSRWALFSVAMMWAIAAGIVVALLLDRFRETATMQLTVAFCVAALLAVAIVTSFLDVDAIVTLYRAVGPIGSLTIELLFLISSLALLALLSQRSGFPALALVVLATVITVIFPIPVTVTVAALTVTCGFFVVMALLSRLWAVAIVAALLAFPGVLTLHEMQKVGAAEANPKPVYNVRQRFECWLDDKGIAAKDPDTDMCPGLAERLTPNEAPSSAKPYPVFIIAVEGGGIYAASAASLFLARLQDHIPGFSDHVFAISGVSGGAIGATIFEALAQSESERAGAPKATPAASVDVAKGRGDPSSRAGEAPALNGCMRRPPGAANLRLTEDVCTIMQDDHFSPIVSAIFPELLGTSMGRAETLAGSFENSVRSHDTAAARALGDTFTAHWPEHARGPALVLNATWVETGFRTAFAPFPLHDIDDTLYSFSDQGMPAERDRSLMYAAVVSARFPGILPPFSVAMNDPNGAKRWNFVDGAYADNSGASTALALYRALGEIATGHNAEIRVILLTSSDPQPDLSKISGTVFRDTLAPIDAVLKVREGLGNEAVARACNQFYLVEPGKDNTNRSAMCRNHARDPNARLWIVEIEDQTYGLPLGWKLSRTTFEIVSWMLGNFESCPKGAPLAKRAAVPGDDAENLEGSSATGTQQLNEATLIRNSCVLSSISDLLGGEQSRPQ